MVEHTEKKDRRRKAAGAASRMTHATHGPGGSDSFPETDKGLSPNLQAHIGRHLRAAFDEVAREPIPDRLLQLLKDLEQNGDK